MDTKKEISELLELIKEKRKEKNISQKEMANFLGIAQPSYQAIEDGKTSLKVETLYQIASYLGISLIQSKTSKSQDLVALNPNDIIDKINKINKVEAKTEDMDKKIDEVNQKLDEILELVKKKKK